VVNELVRTMTYRVCGAIVASLSAVALLLATNETLAESGPAPHGMSVGHATGHPPLKHRFHRRPNSFVFWPGGDGFFGSPTGEPFAGIGQPLSNDVRYTYSYDVPWDWAHRFPPDVVPSDRPYVPSCPSETVTVPGRGGLEQTVNIIRCY